MPKGKQGGKNKGKNITAQDRRLQAVQLRRNGATFDAIGKAIGISTARAHKIVTEELDRSAKQLNNETEQLRQLEVMRLERLLVSISTAITNGQLGAVDKAIKISERLSKLQGLDAPTKLDHTGAIPVTEIIEETVEP